MEKKTDAKAKVVYPDYWAKRKARIKPDLIKELEKSAASEPVETDEYGEYRLGTFLHRNTIVTVKQEDGCWTVHIYSEQPIGLPMIKEIRYKYLPNRLLMAQLFGGREFNREVKGVVLYEIPQADPEPKEEVSE